MSFNISHLPLFYDQFFKRGEITCPTDGCGTTIQPEFIPFTDDDYYLTIYCPECGGLAERLSRLHDPRKNKFRPWTDHEKSAMIDRHFDGERPTCPVDGTPLDDLSADLRELVLECPRCLGKVQTPLPIPRAEILQHDFGVLTIWTTRRPNETEVKVTQSCINCADAGLNLMYKESLEELRTDQAFASVDEAIEFASQQLKLELRSNGVNNRFICRRGARATDVELERM